MQNINYNIKEVDYSDIETYIRINCKSWKESYSGIVNDDFLNFINEEEQIQKSIIK